MFKFDNITKEDIKNHNSSWSKISDRPYIILIIGGFGFGKANSMLNLTSHQPDIDTVYLYAKYACKAKYQLLIHKREGESIKHFNDSKTFIKYQIIWMVFIKILKNIIEIKNEIY